MPPASRSERPHRLADRTWRPPPILTGRSLWQHDVRRLVGGYRVCVPQLETIVGADNPAVVGVAAEDHWELRARRRSDRVTPIVNVDDRMRVVVPEVSVTGWASSTTLWSALTPGSASSGSGRSAGSTG